MVSRRTTLRTGGTALAAVLAGCSGGSDGRGGPTDATSTAGTSSTDGSTSTRTPSDEPTLTAETVAASVVPSGATVVVATNDLLGLVRTAAITDGRVDLPNGGESPRSDETLALGGFDYLRFRDRTYRPTASYAQEGTNQYSATPVENTEDGSDVVAYADLSAAEREIADTLLAGGTYDVGRHEEKPDAVDVLDAHRYLRTENATYRIRVLAGLVAAHHMLRLDPAVPGDDAQVVTVADDPVPRAVRGTVTAAVAEGSAAVSNPDALGAFLDDVDSVVTRHAVARLELLDSA